MGRVSRLTETQLPVVFMPFPPRPLPLSQFYPLPFRPRAGGGTAKGRHSEIWRQSGGTTFPSMQR